MRLFNPFFIALLAIVFLSGGQIQAREANTGNIGPEAAQKMLKQNKDNLLVVDVRTPAEFAAGHLANARNIDFFGANFEREMGVLPKEREILLYCRSGKRSAAAAEMLKKDGFKKVYNLLDGFEGWKKAGLPVEKPAKAGENK